MRSKRILKCGWSTRAEHLGSRVLSNNCRDAVHMNDDRHFLFTFFFVFEQISASGIRVCVFNHHGTAMSTKQRPCIISCSFASPLHSSPPSPLPSSVFILIPCCPFLYYSCDFYRLSLWSDICPIILMVNLSQGIRDPNQFSNGNRQSREFTMFNRFL